MTTNRVLLFVAALLNCGVAAPAETGVFDAGGRITAILNQGEELAIRTDLILPAPGATTPVGLGRSGRGRPVRTAGARTWTGTVAADPGKTARYTQTVSEPDGKLRIEIEVATDVDLEVEGAFFTIEVPRTEFNGGSVRLTGGAGAAKEILLPVVKPARRDSVGGEASALALVSASGGRRLDVALDRARRVWVEDKWDRSGRAYVVYVEVSGGRLAAGAKASIALSLALDARPDSTPARLILDAGQKRYKLRGFGGNYCFNIESPVTQYTLKNLRMGWARTEMTPSEWEPENDNDDPAVTNVDYLKSHDAPDSNLHREFLLAKQIQDLGVPYAISIWQLPEFLYTDPGPTPQRRQRRKIAPDKWDELLECLGSYLLYAKQQYGVEPDLFSFNEANIGVDVLLTPEEHRDAIKRIGAHFEKLGLKTKMLLGDATGPRGTHVFTLAAANDPEAMRYVGAVAFHSWGGGTPEQYEAWGDLAEWLGLPLLVAELGVDAQAYNGGVYDSYHYGMREVRMYQELLLHARPQGAMLWEYTADYGTVRVERNAGGEQELVPTSRFFFLKQFSNLTARNSDALGTRSDNPNVLFTAFVGETAGRPVHTLHVANTGAAREVTIEGLPAGITALRALRTSETENYRELDPVKPEQGTIRVQVPARCLVTLTTMPAE